MADQPFPTPILRTKLHRPQVTPELVFRERLHQLLNGVLTRPLALVSAPAGYGKSMLVSHWAEGLERPCAWLSLDSSDGDRVVFLSYLLAAVRTLFPEACPETASMLKAAARVPLEATARSLANELDKLDSPFVLVLDDYNRIGAASEVHDLLRRLLDHPPQPLRLVIVTRHDPPLGLQTLRAGDDLTEVRLEDLRFTIPETAALLQSATGRTLSDEDLAGFDHSIEGWAVGLRLAALAMRDVGDPARFLRELGGGVQNAQEYLIREVLAGQPREMRDWLLQTSVLDRFCPALCEAVCLAEASSPQAALDGRAFTRELQDGNLFCISLDACGEWFRYHHLFQDLLRIELDRYSDPEEILDLDARASVWFEAQGLIEEAIRHAEKASDEERAAQLVEKHRMHAMNDDQWYVVERWLSLLPGPAELDRPALLLAHAWRLAYGLSPESLPQLLDKVESLLDKESAAGPLRAETDFFRGFFAFWTGDVTNALEHLRNALAGIPEGHHFLRGETEVIFSLANQMEGREKAAMRTLDERLGDSRSIHPVRHARLLAARVFIQILSGDLVSALDSNRFLRQVAEERGYTNAGGWSSYLEGLIHFWRNELPEALPHFHRAVEARYELEVMSAVDAIAGLALTHQAAGRPSDARATLELLFGFAQSRTDTVSLRIAESLRARLALSAHAPTGALALGAEAPDPEPMFFWLEVPAVSRCRHLLAEGSGKSLEMANSELRKCLELNERLHDTRQMIEILPLLALVRQKQGREGDALGLIERAVTLAAPGGWVRPFVEPGPQIGTLLRRLSPRSAVKKEEVYWQIYSSPNDGRERLEIFRERYNEVRPHRALVPVAGGDVVTPADVYCRGVEIQLPAWQGWAKAAKRKLQELMDQECEAA